MDATELLILRAQREAMIAALRTLKADASDFDTTDGMAVATAEIAGLIERRETTKHCKTCGTPRSGHRYWNITGPGRMLLDLAGQRDELLAKLQECLPTGICLTNRNVPDDTPVSIDATMGDLRSIARLIARAKGTPE